MVSFVTGGTRGIGFAVAEAFLRAGYSVSITGTSRDGLERARSELIARAGSPELLRACQCDVRDAAAVESAMNDTVATFGGLDILVNNAGVGLGAPIAELAPEEWRRIIDTNLTGVFHCSKAAIPHLRRRGSGWIINISSLSSKAPFAGAAAYCASKAGLNAFSEALMQELRHDNIRVSAVLPGSVQTGFSGRTTSDGGGNWRLLPEDVAQVILDLVSYPARSLPSRVEIRPSRPQKS